MTRFVHDVSGLPDHAFDTRSLTWWGVLGYIAIAMTVLVVIGIVLFFGGLAWLATMSGH